VENWNATQETFGLRGLFWLEPPVFLLPLGISFFTFLGR
jgi:hypothetical protein